MTNVNAPAQFVVRLRDCVLLRDVSPLRLHYKLEFIWLEQGIVTELQRKIRGFLKFLREVALLLEHVHHDVGVQLHQQVVATAFYRHPLHRALHPANDRLGGEHSTGSVAGRAWLGRGLVMTLTNPLAGHLDQTKVTHRQRPRPRAGARQVPTELPQYPIAIRFRLHVDEVADDEAADVTQSELASD